MTYIYCFKYTALISLVLPVAFIVILRINFVTFKQMFFKYRFYSCFLEHWSLQSTILWASSRRGKL